jgi:ribonuclease R
VTSFGLFVQLDALYVEGLVHITELGGEYFRFDEVRQELRGERTGIRYATGARVHVQVSRVDLDGRRIDFRLVPESGEARLLSRALRDKQGGGESPRSRSAPPASAVEALAQVQRQDRELKAGRRKAASPKSRPSKTGPSAGQGKTLGVAGKRGAPKTEAPRGKRR